MQQMVESKGKNEVQGNKFVWEKVLCLNSHKGEGQFSAEITVHTVYTPLL